MEGLKNKNLSEKLRNLFPEELETTTSVRLKKMAQTLVETLEIRKCNEELYSTSEDRTTKKGFGEILKALARTMKTHSEDGLILKKKHLEELKIYVELFAEEKRIEELETTPEILLTANETVDLRTGKASEEDRITRLWKTTVSYNENAGTEIPEQFFRGIIIPEKTTSEEQEEAEKDYLILQEFAGYCLINDTRFEKSLFLFGKGSNGKTTIARALSMIMATKQISFREAFEDMFGLCEMEGIPLNIIEELPDGETNGWPTFKQAITGGPITVNEKHKQKREIQLKTKFLCLGNTLPSPPKNQQLDALWRRVFLIECKNKFEKEDSAERIEETTFKTEEAKQQLLKWTIDGAKRLLNKGWTVSQNQKKLAKKWQQIADSAGAFVNEMTKLDENAEISKNDFYEAYCEYCAKNDLTRLGPIKLTEAIREKHARIREKTRRMQEGKWSETFWVGVSVRKDEEQLKIG